MTHLYSARRWILIFLLIILGCGGFERSTKTNLFPSSRLYGEIRIKISGTKNAYTTLRPKDVVLFKPSTESTAFNLGVFDGSSVFHLVQMEEGSYDFIIDKSRPPRKVEDLTRSDLLYRIVSSSCTSGGLYTIEEYLSSDVEVGKTLFPDLADTQANYSIDLVAKLNIARLELQVLEAKLNVAKLELQAAEAKLNIARLDAL